MIQLTEVQKCVVVDCFERICQTLEKMDITLQNIERSIDAAFRIKKVRGV